MKRIQPKLLPVLLGALLGVASIGPASAADPAVATYSATALTWQARIAYDDVFLRVVGANGYVYEKDFGSAQPAFSIAANGARLPDGKYTYELVFARVPSPQLEQAIAAQRQPDGSFANAGIAEQAAGLRVTHSGTFTIANGQVLSPALSESRSSSPQDIVQADDVIVQGSLCVGFDCVNNESFGFDTIRLKENNTRIKFEDTSVGEFPSTDWQLTANDSASGGANKFSIEDVTAARVPFTITGGAASNSIFVDASGRVGFRTATPVLDLHVATSNTPALRLEQNNAGGFSAQTWDVAGNEANFFVRDVTSGSRLPLRIRPGAPTSSVDIAANGNVGVGTASPSSSLHVSRSDGTAQLRVQESSAVNTGRNQVSLFNNGDTRIRMDNGTSAWHLSSSAVDFRMAAPLASNQFVLTTAGNLTITGTLTQGSSREIKDNIAPANAGAILSRVASLPLYTWNYKATLATHVGPMAEEFHDRFELGSDNKHIAPSDMAGIALGAVQALNALLTEKDAEIQALKERLLRLERLIGN
jgi:hypothetical protein